MYMVIPNQRGRVLNTRICKVYSIVEWVSFDIFEYHMDIFEEAVCTD